MVWNALASKFYKCICSTSTTKNLLPSIVYMYVYAWRPLEAREPSQPDGHSYRVHKTCIAQMNVDS